MGKNVVLIPVRGGSKSIPLKNIKEICGKPLVYWTAKAACEANCIDEVYVATDSSEIERCVIKIKQDEKDIFDKLKVIGRSVENASDTASTESVMLEFAKEYEFANIFLIQATSPLLTSDDLEGGYSEFCTENTDSVLSVVRQKRFLWDIDNEGFANPSNYDVYNRPRRQEFNGYLMENGAFYITSKGSLLTSKNRVSGKIKVYEMPEETALEIDEPEDFVIIQSLLYERLRKLKRECISNIKMVVMDIDGCLTDGGMYYSENGDELKKFNTKDGMAISMLNEKGIITGIITGENRELNRRRAEKLHMHFIKQGIKDKATCLRIVCEEYKVSLADVLYIGDDINDLEAMKISGYRACPADAEKAIIDCSDYTASKCGGMGILREILKKYGLIQI